MAQNIGTLVSAAIRPNDSNDPFASAFSNEIMGGFHSYKELNDRDTIIPLRRQWDMLVSVYDDVDDSNNGIYQLKYNYKNTIITDNGNWVKTTIDGKNAVTEWADSVISILLNEPSTPTTGDRYLLGITSSTSPSGTKWNSNTATTIVEYNSNSSWDITVPINGMTVRIDNDDNAMYKYVGTYPNGEWKLEKVTNVFYINPLSTNGASYSTTTSPNFNTYTNDLIFLAKFAMANSGNASLNINGIGHKVIKIATTSGLRNLLVGDIDITSIYSLSYNGTEFQLTKPFASDAHNIEFYIPVGETMLVQDFEQYWVYGDLTVAGSLVNYGKVVIANGGLILEGTGSHQLEGDGELILVDLFNTPIFNDTSTIELTSELTTNGPSFSAIIKNSSITTGLLDVASGSPIDDYLLSTDGAGRFKWVTGGGGGGGGISGSGTSNYIAKFTGSSSLGTSSIFDDGTLVGIGRIPSTGNGVLQINGGNSAIAIQTSGIGNAGTIEAKDTAIGGATIQMSPQISNGVPGITVGNFPLVFHTDSQERMRITSTGSVGIGTASPSTKLHIFATQSGAFRLEDTTQGPGYVLTSDVNGVGTWANPTSTFYIQGGTTYSFDTTSNIYRTGTLDIGTNSTPITNKSLLNVYGRVEVLSGTFSVFVGRQAGASSSSTLGLNTAFGDYALWLNVNGRSNTAIGASTMLYMTFGANNIGVGSSAFSGTSLISASFSDNVGIGSSAQRLANGSSFNISVGNSTLFNNTNGSRNVAIGHNSLFTSTSSTGNNAIGFQSLSRLTTGQYNAVVGWNSGAQITTGSNNTIIGLGFSTETTLGITTGSNNTIIGSIQLTAGEQTASNQIFIGDGNNVRRISVSSAGLMSINSTETTFSGILTTTQFRLSALNTAPSNATASGTLGEIRVLNDYIYVCIATDTWRRTQLLDW